MTAYFLYDVYTTARYTLYQTWVTQGYSQAVGELIGKVGGKCDAPTPVNIGDKKIEIIDTVCLKAPTPVKTPEPVAPPKK